LKYVEIIADPGSLDTLKAIAEKARAADLRTMPPGEDGMQQTRMLIADDRLQSLLDALQNVLGAQHTARISVLPIEVALPEPPEKEEREEDKATEAREKLRSSVEKGARLNLNHIVLVVLSTVVAAIGLLEDSVAVVIGAMVIAPLLGPNLAFALGTALGDLRLMREAAATLFLGLAAAVAVAAAIGIALPLNSDSAELMARTQVGWDSIALALASGAAAALSLTTGLSSVLVGVMVAVALLPPAATLGLMLGNQEAGLAQGAGLLLAINIVCVNLATKLVFLVKRISPRAWREKERARRGMTIYIIAWVLMLALLAGVIYLRRVLPG
jgi:uncharacterized hydrophobic protein (TIGR00341 family)